MKKDNIVKKTRIKLGYTQKDVAEAVNVSIRTIQSIEQGIRKPGSLLAIEIFNFLDISLDKLEFFLRSYTTK